MFLSSRRASAIDGRYDRFVYDTERSKDAALRWYRDMLKADEDADLRAGIGPAGHRGPERLFAAGCFVLDGKRRASGAQRVHSPG
jgi:hypothetical protein